MTRKSEYIPARRNARETESELAQRISRQLLDLVSKIPPTREAAGADADARARALTLAPRSFTTGGQRRALAPPASTMIGMPALSVGTKK